MSPLIMYMTSSLGSTWNSLRSSRPRATKAMESAVCQSTLIGRVALAMTAVISSRSMGRMAFRSMGVSSSVEREQAPRVVDQDGLDLRLRETAPAHHRHHVGEDVAVAVPAKAHQARAVADVVRDQHLAEVPARDQPPDGAEADRVVRHVDVGQPVVG